jgi:hypothetical protein
MQGEARCGNALDALAAPQPGRPPAVLAVVAVEADHLAEEVERRDLLPRAAAERHQLAEKDRVGAVARVDETLVPGEVEVAIDRG